MRVLVLGASGMAGHVVAIYLREQGFDVETLAAKNVLDENTYLIDVTDRRKLETLLKRKKFGAVINCIGLLVKQSEKRKDLASYLNSYLPHFLENYYQSSKTRLIHLSTDCVFSGKNPPYKEDSAHDGESFYDRSKSLGEVINHKDLTFRMSIIGPEINDAGVGLFNWFYSQKGEIIGYKNVIWNGITTIELAKAVKEALSQNLTGLYHLVPRANISKYDLLQLFKKKFGRSKLVIKPKTGESSNKTLLNSRVDFSFEVSNYEVMIEEMRDWIDAHKTLYKHYGRGD